MFSRKNLPGNASHSDSGGEYEKMKKDGQLLLFIQKEKFCEFFKP